MATKEKKEIRPKSINHTEMRTTVDPRLHSEQYHHHIHTISDWVAFRFVKFLAFFADLFFRKKYGHRAVVLETVAAVPGMVGGLLQHLKSLRWLRDDRGWIKTLLDEAENERIHLLVYTQITKPTVFERFLIMFTQAVFYNIYFFIYLFSSRTAHRIVGYFEEEAIKSYTHYLAQVERGEVFDVAAPELAVTYWKLGEEAKLSDVIKATREDEVHHRDVNHSFADKLTH